ncbi:MAG: rRNA maturation RNase YbeY [Phycisphaerales bacterium]|nr:rRNA maturation RNase YbeY [Phycisphaerales bacterium]
MRALTEEPPTADGDACARARPGVPAAGVSIDIVDAEGVMTAEQVAWLTAKVGEAMAILGSGGAGGSVSVRVVGDTEMAAAHERYKGVGGTTDVLTFDLSEGDGGLEADLLVCVDEARRQARARGHGEERELLLYVIHGVLHCLGHDDHGEAEAARMHAEEDRVLMAIGVGATFAREATP